MLIVQVLWALFMSVLFNIVSVEYTVITKNNFLKISGRTSAKFEQVSAELSGGHK